jgi:hypothetical protein
MKNVCQKNLWVKVCRRLCVKNFLLPFTLPISLLDETLIEALLVSSIQFVLAQFPKGGIALSREPLIALNTRLYSFLNKHSKTVSLNFNIVL